MNEYQQKIESLLFYQNQPVSYQWLSRNLGISISNTKDEVHDMVSLYEDRGVQVVSTEDTIALVTHRSQAELINSLKDQEQSKELSKQALETLAIILFKKSIAKAEIDFIRGVNSVYILRHLMIRGLIEKKNNPHDKRSPLYTPTIDTLSYLGVSTIEEIQGYQQYSQKLQKISQEYRDEINNNEAE